MARLHVKNGPLTGQRIEVTADLVIGRTGVDVTLDDDQVSRRHAVVRQVPGGLEVEDLGSSNGTFVNGDKIEGPTRVGGGAQITLGTTVLEVEGVIPAPSGETPGLQATKVSSIPGDVTRAQEDQPAAAAQAAQPAAPPATPAAGPQAPAAPAAPAPPAGTFQPPKRRRGRGLASRSWVPVALSFGTVVLTAIALVVYFAAR